MRKCLRELEISQNLKIHVFKARAHYSLNLFKVTGGLLLIPNKCFLIILSNDIITHLNYDFSSFCLNNLSKKAEVLIIRVLRTSSL